jgi:DNA-binding response OmpR family regulator
MKNILLVEDEREIREFEKDYLTNAKYSVIEAETGKEALELFQKKKCDLVILDLNLPIIDGIEVCKRIRKLSGVPILMVTARTKEIDELIGLEVGADDYIKKPFSPKVLVARVKTLLKRPTWEGSKEILKYGNLEIDIPKQKVIKKGKELFLTTVQFSILVLLAQNKGKVYTRNELIDGGYDASLPPDIFDRTIDSHIKNIRKVLEDDSKEPRYILTIRGKGYKFNDKI